MSARSSCDGDGNNGQYDYPRFQPPIFGIATSTCGCWGEQNETDFAEGWAVMILASLRPELFGPVIVAGAPLAYWAGLHGKYRPTRRSAEVE